MAPCSSFPLYTRVSAIKGASVQTDDTTLWYKRRPQALRLRNHAVQLVVSENVASRVLAVPLGTSPLAGRGQHPSLLVLANAALKEVGLALHANHVHPVERIRGVVERRCAKPLAYPIGHELYVLRHEVGVHPNEAHRQGVAHESLLDFNGLADDAMHGLGVAGPLQHVVQHARKVAVQALVPADQLVAEAQAGHEAPLLQPEDRAERPGEEDAFHRGEGDQPFSERARAVHPSQRPVGLSLDAGHGAVSPQQLPLLHRILHVRVQQERVRLRVHALHGDLEAVEASCLRQRDLPLEVVHQVLHDDAVAAGEERQNHAHEVLLPVIQLRPVVQILAEVDLLRRPEAGLVLLVELPQLRVPDRKQHEARRIISADRLHKVCSKRFERKTKVRVKRKLRQQSMNGRLCFPQRRERLCGPADPSPSLAVPRSPAVCSLSSSMDSSPPRCLHGSEAVRLACSRRALWIAPRSLPLRSPSPGAGGLRQCQEDASAQCDAQAVAKRRQLKRASPTRGTAHLHDALRGHAGQAS
eukprot:scaffold109_cov252-Pinguiococcus_pyrenoidosus.AAC.55